MLKILHNTISQPVNFYIYINYFHLKLGDVAKSSYWTLIVIQGLLEGFPLCLALKSSQSEET